MIIITNIKSFLQKTFLQEFSQQLKLLVFENKRTFMKKAVLYATTLMHCKARHVLHDLFSTNKRNG